MQPAKIIYILRLKRPAFRYEIFLVTMSIHENNVLSIKKKYIKNFGTILSRFWCNNNNHRQHLRPLAPTTGYRPLFCTSAESVLCESNPQSAGHSDHIARPSRQATRGRHNSNNYLIFQKTKCPVLLTNNVDS